MLANAGVSRFIARPNRSRGIGSGVRALVIQAPARLPLVWRHGKTGSVCRIFASFSREGPSGRQYPRHPAGVGVPPQKAFVSTGIGVATIRSWK